MFPRTNQLKMFQAYSWRSFYEGGEFSRKLMYDDGEDPGRFPFSLLCGYPTWLVADEASAAEVEAVCRLHTGVIGREPGQPGEEKISGAECELLKVVTTGDKQAEWSLSKQGGKGQTGQSIRTKTMVVHGSEPRAVNVGIGRRR